LAQKSILIDFRLIQAKFKKLRLILIFSEFSVPSEIDPPGTVHSLREKGVLFASLPWVLQTPRETVHDPQEGVHIDPTNRFFDWILTCPRKEEES